MNQILTISLMDFTIGTDDHRPDLVAHKAPLPVADAQLLE
jgi:hypothetical protein